MDSPIQLSRDPQTGERVIFTANGSALREGDVDPNQFDQAWKAAGNPNAAARVAQAVDEMYDDATWSGGEMLGAGVGAAALGGAGYGLYKMGQDPTFASDVAAGVSNKMGQMGEFADNVWGGIKDTGEALSDSYDQLKRDSHLRTANAEYPEAQFRRIGPDPREYSKVLPKGNDRVSGREAQMKKIFDAAAEKRAAAGITKAKPLNAKSIKAAIDFLMGGKSAFKAGFRG